jgi:membrane-associated phospholipid phosphatase
MISFSQFLQFIEKRNGAVLPDPLLNIFSPIDLTWLTFSLIYLSIIVFLISIIKEPDKLLIAMQAYGLMVIFRTIAMYLVPLEPPETMLLLNDPFVQLFGKGEILTKDLFFSGHTATLFLLFLLTEKKTLKFIFLISTFIVGISVLLQHVHYSIDVFVAPFVAYSSYRIIKIYREKISLNSN